MIIFNTRTDRNLTLVWSLSGYNVDVNKMCEQSCIHSTVKISVPSRPEFWDKNKYILRRLLKTNKQKIDLTEQNFEEAKLMFN